MSIYFNRSHLLVLSSAVLAGTIGTAQTFAPVGASPIAVGGLRLVVGGIVLMGWAAFRGVLSIDRSWIRFSTLAAGASMAAFTPLFLSAVAKTGVAVGTMTAIGSAPLAAGVMAYLLRREKPDPRWMAATFLSIIGCCLLAFASKSNVEISVTGLILAFFAGIAFAGFNMASKQLLEDHPSEAVMAVAFCLAALIIMPIIMLTDLTWVMNGRGFAVILYLGIMTTGVTYTLLSQGLKTIPVATAVTLNLAEPLTAALLGVIVVGESLSLLTASGAGFIFCGLLLLAVKWKTGI
jgi:DME family drug/metabolite transporter